MGPEAAPRFALSYVYATILALLGFILASGAARADEGMWTFSLGGDYGYDPAANRTVAVDSRALLEGLRTVYHLDRIVTEIDSAQSRN
jgi:hypothetical protein